MEGCAQQTNVEICMYPRTPLRWQSLHFYINLLFLVLERMDLTHSSRSYRQPLRVLHVATKPRPRRTKMVPPKCIKKLRSGRRVVGETGGGGAHESIHRGPHHNNNGSDDSDLAQDATSTSAPPATPAAPAAPTRDKGKAKARGLSQGYSGTDTSDGEGYDGHPSPDFVAARKVPCTVGHRLCVS